MTMAIKVDQNEDGSFEISWDENHPTESMFNTWTAEDFTKAISDYLEKLKNEEQET